jgi:hypothetical protein
LPSLRLAQFVSLYVNLVEAFFVCSRRSCRLSVLLGVSAFLGGCGGAGDAPTTVPVKGVVKYQGKPIAKLSVAFLPDKGVLATGTTNAEGAFELTTNKPGDGAMVGSYRVAISFVPDEIPVMPGFPGSEKKPPDSPIPTKYADVRTSGLTKTVDQDATKNNFTFDLTD